MNIEHHVVTHKVLGEGVVTKHDGKYITVSFGTDEKKFQFPESFREFLQATDSVTAETISNLLQEITDNERHMQQRNDILAKQSKDRKTEQKRKEAEVIKLKNEFHDAMWEYHKLRIQKKYHAGIVEDMLNEYGGYDTACRLIKKEDTDGLKNLGGRRLLHYSIEALVLNPKYSTIFSATERKMCEERLEKYRRIYYS